jgi:dimethylargininase
MKYAITRDVSSRIGQCELTHLNRVPIDLGRARRQHEAYCSVLGELGWTIIRLPASSELPDSVFVEDTALVTDDVAILTNPGAASRRREVMAVAEMLGKLRKTLAVQPPATLDGGDVLLLGREIWVGIGARTNEQSISLLRDILGPYGFTVREAHARGCLHLKSAVTRAGADFLVVNANWIEPRTFAGWKIIEVDPQEPLAANVLWLGDVTLVAEAYPRTRDRMEACGIKCRTIDVSELAKAEGALTCCSLLFEA